MIVKLLREGFINVNAALMHFLRVLSPHSLHKTSTKHGDRIKQALDIFISSLIVCFLR